MFKRKRPEEAARNAEEASDADRVGYGSLWDPGDESEARQLILNERDEAIFEETGRSDAESLSAHVGPDSVVVDLGCGIGRVARYLASQVGILWAVDASPSMLRFAQDRMGHLPNVRYAQCIGTAVPDVESNSVDLVYALLVLQHLEREDAFALLRDVRRFLKPTGKAVLTFPNLLSDTYLEVFLHYVDTGEVKNKARARLYTPEEVTRILPAAGFDIDKIDPGIEIWVHCSPGT